MKRVWLVILAIIIPSAVSAQTGKGPFTLIGVLRRLDGRDFEFDAGIARHWQWHRDHHDPYVWYTWDIRFSGERIGGLVFASFNHSAGSLDSAVAPAEDWADWRVTGAPVSAFTNLETYRYLPELSRGTGDPGPAVLLELTTVDLQPAATAAFEAKLKSGSRLSTVIEGGSDDQLLAQATAFASRVTMELLISEPSLTIDAGH
jgi:hypothetical protein